MVKITESRAQWKGVNACAKDRNEKRRQQTRHITHLYASDSSIDAIGNLAASKHLKVLYLQNNCLSKIENLHLALNVTHLYLQHNNITRIENLHVLEKLEKLYLGHNRINVVEGLENQRNLRELHIEHQRTENGASLCFEPRSARVLANCLEILRVSGNRMRSLGEIEGFRELRTLEARDNLIDDVGRLAETVATLPALEELSLQGNPVTRRHTYRENLVANSGELKMLDGKIVTDVCRRFMKSLKLETQSRRWRRKPAMSLSDDITSSLNLPPAFQRSISRAIFQYPGASSTTTLISASGEGPPRVFPSWKSAVASSAIKDNRVLPRPFWRNSSTRGGRNGRKLGEPVLAGNRQPKDKGTHGRKHESQ